MATSTNNSKEQVAEPGLFGKILNLILKIIGVLLIALFFSVISEWIGMTWFWPEEGSQHAQDMLVKEISYLNNDFKKSIITSSPSEFVGEFAQAGHYYFIEWTGVTRVIEWLATKPTGNSSDIHLYTHNFFMSIWEYVLAMLGVFEVFLVRLGVLLLATPVFILALVAGFADGLVQRDLRRWGGGRESSFLYHYAKKAVVPSVIGAWILYLAIPVSIHPSFIILPFAVLGGMSAAISASTFKKYL